MCNTLSGSKLDGYWGVEITDTGSNMSNSQRLAGELMRSSVYGKIGIDKRV
jgi:hypothetical protein